MNVTIAGVDVSSNYKPDELSAIQLGFSASDGEIGTGTLPVPEDGSLVTYAGRSAVLDEDSTTVFDGFLGERLRNRSAGDAGTRRLVTVTTADTNALLHGQTAYKWSRPKETDRARMLAFAADFLPSDVTTTWVLNTNNRTVPKKVYTTDDLFTDLQADMGDLTGKTGFMVGRDLHWHLFTEGDTAGLAISDVSGEYDNITTFFPDSANSPSLRLDPADLIVTATAYNSKGQTATYTDAAKKALYDVDGIKHHKLVDLSDGTHAELVDAAKATVLANRAERLTYECDIGPLTSAQVALLPPGALMNVTSQMWGLTNSTQRIAQLSITRRHPGKWMAHITMAFPVRIRKKPTPVATPTTPVTPQPLPPPLLNVPCVVDLGTALGGFAITLNDDPVNNTLTAGGGGIVLHSELGFHIVAESPQSFSLPAVISGRVLLPATPALGTLEAFGIGVNGPPGAEVQQGLGINVLGTGGVAHIYAKGGGSSVTTDIPGGVEVGFRIDLAADLSVGVSVWPISNPADIWNAGGAAPGGATTPTGWAVEAGGGTSTVNADWTVTNLQLDQGGDCTTGSALPAGYAGSSYGPIDMGLGNGTQTVFTFPYPYVPGTLAIEVDGTFQTVTELDPAVGTFQLSFAPTSTERIFATATIDPSAGLGGGGPIGGSTDPGPTTGGGSAGGVGGGTSAEAYGSAATDTKANMQIGGHEGDGKGQCAVRFRASTTANLASVQFEQRGGPVHGGTADGYSSQDAVAGSFTITIEADNGHGAPSGVALATQAYSPSNSNPTGAWTIYDSVTFSSPAGLISGQLYYFVLKNDATDIASGYFSINHVFCYTAITPRQPFIADEDFAVLQSLDGGASWAVKGQYTAVIDLVYDDATHDGQAYIGNIIADFGTISGASDMVRETFTVTGGDKTVDTASVRVRRSFGSGPLNIRLETGSHTLIEDVDIPATLIPISAAGSDDGGAVWVTAAFASGHVLTNGSSYNLVLSTDAGTEYTAACILQGDSVGMGSFAFRDGGGEKTTDGGSTWDPLYAFDDVDIQFSFRRTA